MVTTSDPSYRPVPIAWNDATLLKAAGGNPEKLKTLLRDARQPLPSDMAVYMWYSRGAVSNIWRPRLVYALLRAGRIKFEDIFRLAEAPRGDA